MELTLSPSLSSTSTSTMTTSTTTISPSPLELSSTGSSSSSSSSTSTSSSTAVSPSLSLISSPILPLLFEDSSASPASLSFSPASRMYSSPQQPEDGLPAIASSSVVASPLAPAVVRTTNSPLRQQQQQQQSQQQSQHQPHQRSRTGWACEFCRKQHKRCEGIAPCRNCINHQIECVFGIGKKRGPKKGHKQLPSSASPPLPPPHANANSSDLLHHQTAKISKSAAKSSTKSATAAVAVAAAAATASAIASSTPSKSRKLSVPVTSVLNFEDTTTSPLYSNIHNKPSRNYIPLQSPSPPLLGTTAATTNTTSTSKPIPYSTLPPQPNSFLSSTAQTQTQTQTPWLFSDAATAAVVIDGESASASIPVFSFSQPILQVQQQQQTTQFQSDLSWLLNEYHLYLCSLLHSYFSVYHLFVHPFHALVPLHFPLQVSRLVENLVNHPNGPFQPYTALDEYLYSLSSTVPSTTNFINIAHENFLVEITLAHTFLKVGHKQHAQEFILKAQISSEQFLNTTDSYLVACAFQLMAYFYFLDNQLEQALFFTERVQKLCNNLQHLIPNFHQSDLYMYTLHVNGVILPTYSQKMTSFTALTQSKNTRTVLYDWVLGSVYIVKTQLQFADQFPTQPDYPTLLQILMQVETLLSSTSFGSQTDIMLHTHLYTTFVLLLSKAGLHAKSMEFAGKVAALSEDPRYIYACIAITAPSQFTLGLLHRNLNETAAFNKDMGKLKHISELYPLASSVYLALLPSTQNEKISAPGNPIFAEFSSFSPIFTASPGPPRPPLNQPQ